MLSNFKRRNHCNLLNNELLLNCEHTVCRITLAPMKLLYGVKASLEQWWVSCVCNVKPFFLLLLSIIKNMEGLNFCQVCIAVCVPNQENRLQRFWFNIGTGGKWKSFNGKLVLMTTKAGHRLSNFLSFKHGLKETKLLDSPINTVHVGGGINHSALL